MDLPTDLAQWTYETVAEVVTKHAFEPSQFDFKEVLIASHGGANRLNESIRQTACAMANSDGGFIIFGVMDAQKAQQQGIPISDPRRIVGIPSRSETLKEFGDKVRPIQPDLFFEPVPSSIPVPTNPAMGVFVVYIPRSPRRPHMVDSVFYRRDGGGTNAKMNYFEVYNIMMLTEDRLRRANVLRLDLAQHRKQVEIMRGMEGESILSCLLRFDTSAIKPLLADACVIIPPGDDLIPQLLRLPPLANTINRFLDRGNELPTRQDLVDMGQDPNLRTEHSEKIRQHLEDLDGCCAVCEQRLDQLLGPLSRLTAAQP